MKRTVLALACLLYSAAGGTEAPAKGKAVGSPNAPITIEVFNDFQCPSCKILHEQVLRLLIRDYVVPGKVYLIHHEFPLPSHPYARLAASYAEAAARIGKYQEVADVLFLNQVVWAANGKVDQTVASVLTPAEASKIRAMAKDPGIEAEIQHDVDLGRAKGINQTPTMIVIHRSIPYPISGAVNYDLLRGFLDGRLGK
ncbi:MAG: thioredoxin domain-containing protein [Bryobacteraceae bacterium]|jgi:protein-disulfide isomerase